MKTIAPIRSILKADNKNKVTKKNSDKKNSKKNSNNNKHNGIDDKNTTTPSSYILLAIGQLLELGTLFHISH